MVRNFFGKGCVFVFILLAVSVALEHDTPLFIIWSWFGKSICLSFNFLQGHILSRLWVNAAKSLVVSFICSREVHPKPLLSWPPVVVHSLRVDLPSVQSNLHHTLFHLQNLLLILCHWWGIHWGPPVTSFVPLTPAHYLETRLRNSLVPWNLHASMASFLTFDSGFTSLIPDQKISSNVRLQLTHSHSMDCTTVPWESLTSMVISLALINSYINDR